MRKLALYGAGALGLEALAAVTADAEAWARYDEILFVDDDPAATVPVRARVVGFTGLLREASVNDVEVAVCIADDDARRAVAERVGEAGLAVVDVPGAQVGD